MTKYHLRPVKFPPKVYPVVAFDVEGTGEKNGFIMGCVHDLHGSQTFHERTAMARYLTTHANRDAKIVAHNLEYDWGCLFQDSFAGWQLLRIDSRLIRAKFTDRAKHTWEFWDTANLSGFQSLGALGAILGFPKLETPEYIKAGGVVHPHRSQLTPEQLTEIEFYCQRDAEICYRFACFLQDELNALGGEIRPTLAGCAMDLFKRAYMGREYKTPWRHENAFYRDGYYGGRTEAVIYGRSEDVYQYDVHSMYPYCMRNFEYPDPNATIEIKLLRSGELIEQHEGMSCVTVHCPDMHLPVLPYRIGQRLIFPVGTMRGTWTHAELRYAVRCGYTIEEIHRQFVAFTSCRPFTDYVTELFKRKQDADKAGSPARLVYKLMLNSLYGKFGQRDDCALTKLAPLREFSQLEKDPALILIEWNGQILAETPVTAGKQPDYVNVLWAAYVTAYGRILLHQKAASLEGSLVYMDTDCIVGEREFVNNDALGGWGLEVGPATFDVRAEKYYRYSRDEQHWAYKKAGVPRALQEEYWHTGFVEYMRPTRIGESIRGRTRISVWRMVTKGDCLRHYKRCPIVWDWQEGDTVPTRPWTVAQAEAHFAAAPTLPPWVKFPRRPERWIEEHETRAVEGSVRNTKMETSPSLNRKETE